MTHNNDSFLGLCENLAPAGMDGRESTRIRTPVKTPKRFRSASSPFASPMSDAMLTGKLPSKPLNLELLELGKILF